MADSQLDSLSKQIIGLMGKNKQTGLEVSHPDKRIIVIEERLTTNKNGTSILLGRNTDLVEGED